mgnify:CR=1 FL=1
MHLLVLSAFRQRDGGTRYDGRGDGLNAPFGAQCFPTPTPGTSSTGTPRVSMHLLVLSAFRRKTLAVAQADLTVSMHLLVLSAFRRKQRGSSKWRNAVSMHLLVLSAFRLLVTPLTIAPSARLNAPFGAQCFPTRGRRRPQRLQTRRVSMHLLVLSAFRPASAIGMSARIVSQCTFWCSVLSDPATGE